MPAHEDEAPGIEVSDLVKRYGDLVAVDGVSFEARSGAVFGLLGPNGAGKSTAIGCICGLLAPSEGSVRVLGHELRRDRQGAKACLGVVPQELALYEDLSARANLAFFGAAYGLRGAALAERVDAVLGICGLADRAKEPVKRFSGGMKRRLNLGCGLVHRPRVLLLDEPTVGVDPQSRVRLLELVRAEVANGTTVLYTTHYMEEAEELCDELAILDHGKILAQGSLDALRGMLGERDLLRLTGSFEPGIVQHALGALAEVEIVQVEADLLRLTLPEASRRLPELFAALTGKGATIAETTVTRPSLETLFIKLTGRELRE